MARETRVRQRERGEGGRQLNDAASGSRQDIVPRKKGSYNASTQLDPHTTFVRVRMGDSRSINGQARTLIICAFSSGLLVRTHELQGGDNLAQVT